MEITDNKIKISNSGITFPQGTTIEEWTETLSMLKTIRRCYHLALADTIIFGKAAFGEEVVAECMVQMEFPQADFNHATDISRIPIGLRRDSSGLTSEHYHVIGRTFSDDEVSQKKWIESAAANSLSPTELRRSIEAGTVLKDDPNRSGKSSGGLVTIQSIMFTFQKWTSQVGGVDRALKWPEAEKIDFLRQTKEVADLREKIENSLPARPNPEL